MRLGEREAIVADENGYVAESTGARRSVSSAG